jgi:type II secretory pathway component GspD/PulD (secretin)
MNLKLLTVFLLFLFITSCAPKQAVKQEEQPPAPLQTEELKTPDNAQKKEILEEKKPEAAVEKKPEEQYVMLNFENADISTVISTISEMLKLNYILSPGVAGKITIQSQSKVPLSELFSTFQTILEFNGFTAIKDGSFYRIVPIDTAKQQPVKVDSGKNPAMSKDASFTTQQIPLDYVKASDVANIVRNLMPRGTDIIVYEPSNMLIVTAPPAGIIKTMKLLEAIDIPATERDSVKTFVYNVENGEAKKLAEVLKSIYGKQKAGEVAVKTTAPTPAVPQSPVRRPISRTPAPPPAAKVEGTAGTVEGEVVFDSYEDINALIIKATPRAYLSLLETIKRLDTQPRQVLIEVLIAEVTLDRETDLGLEWIALGHGEAFNKQFNIITGNAQNPGSFFQQSTSTVDPVTGAVTTAANLSQFAPLVSGTGGLFANIFNPKEFNILISALAKNGDVNVLASPQILALDNKEAKIEIAQEVPVASTISQPQTTTELTTSQIQFKSVGIILTVTPQINEKKQVTLKISQEASQIGNAVLIAGQAYTGFLTRKANTTAIVQDGHTLVIGGIIQERTEQSRSGIPFLSELPLLGYLFGTTTDKKSRTELLLLVTPHVVANAEEADMLTEEYTNKVKGLTKKIEEREKKENGEGNKVDQGDIHIHVTTDASKIEEEQKQTAEQEKLKQAEDARKQAAEQEKLKQADEAKKQTAEQEKVRQAEEGKKQAAEQEKVRQAEEAKKQTAEQEKLKQAEEAQKRAVEQEKLRQNEENQNQAEEGQGEEENQEDEGQ